MKRINKRGLSPIITTVLLIAIAIVLAVIILLWARNFVPELVTKNGSDIKKVCKDVYFEADYNPTTSEILVANTGNVNIFSFSIEEELPGRTLVTEKRVQDTAGTEIDLGNGGSGKIPVTFASGTTIVIKPVLLGYKGEQEAKYVCVDHTGVELQIP